MQKIELPIARKRHEDDKARLVPVIVRKCSWERYVGDIQGLPKGGQPVKQWGDRDDACYDIEQGLRQTIAEMRKRPGRF